MAQNAANRMTPLYNIPVSMFEKQLAFFAKESYKSLFLDDVEKLSADGKYIIFTFDDGLKGNFHHALPVLKAYGFKATIFVAVDRIGSEGFMQWSDLERMLDQGIISIQSHTMSHRPLSNLNHDEICKELQNSKQIIEKRLGKNVTAISLPHGSYNEEVTSLAKKIGYRFLCTSDVERVYQSSFLNTFAVLGRIAMTNKMSLNKLSHILEYKKYVLMQQRLAKTAKNTFKRIIGIENYRYLYRKFFNIKLVY